MNEWTKTFLSIASIIGGIACLLIYFEELQRRDWDDIVLLLLVGVLLLAGGATHLWMRSKVRKD
jgi:uncharacterized membrane protein HdeD (DUF308 family)